ncbi:MAG: hypothetical protein KGY46_02230 [Anaerolineales bacterium]|nr:hypothetical protein [Anaerolineales bacterium]
MDKIRWLLISIILIILSGISACNYPTTTPEGQTFSVVPVYEDMLAYINAAREAEDPDLEALLEAHVLKPNWETCAGKEYRPPPGSIFDKPIQDLDALEETIHQLQKSDIEKVVKAALQKSAQKLAGPDTTVCIIAADPTNWFIQEKMHGVNGWTFGAGKIILQVNPAPGWKNWVPYIIAHEYHHSAWTDRYYQLDDQETLIENLVFEGRADSFAHIIYPHMEVPWVNALSAEEEQVQWEKILNEGETTNTLVKTRFLVGGDQNTPTWTGYTIGYHIVQSYLDAHPQADIETWTTLSPHELLEQSGYQGGY